MNSTRKASTLFLVLVFGLALMTSTKPTAAYSVTSSANQTPPPAVGVLFSTAYMNAYLAHHAHHRAAHHASGCATLKEEPVNPEYFFDRK